jgi:voltage-gated potassium channel
MVPETVAGKMLGGVITVIGIGTLALFSGLITVSFLDQLRLRREQAAGPAVSPDLCPHCGRPLIALRQRLEAAPAGE